MKTAREILCKVTGHSDDKLDLALIYTDDALNAMKEYAIQFIDLAANSIVKLNTGGNRAEGIYVVSKKDLLKIKELIK